MGLWVRCTGTEPHSLLPCFPGRSHPTEPWWGCSLSGPSGKSLLTSGLDARGLAPCVADAGRQWSREGQEHPGKTRRRVGCTASAGGGRGLSPADPGCCTEGGVPGPPSKGPSSEGLGSQDSKSKDGDQHRTPPLTHCGRGASGGQARPPPPPALRPGGRQTPSHSTACAGPACSLERSARSLLKLQCSFLDLVLMCLILCPPCPFWEHKSVFFSVPEPCG